MERNYFNRHLTDAQMDRIQRRQYYRELASIATGGDREETKKVARALHRIDREEENKPRKLTKYEQDFNKQADDLMRELFGDE